MAVLPAAWLYAWLTMHIPFIFNFLPACAFAIWLLFIAKFVAGRAKARNPRWMGRLGVVIGLVGWYCQWTAWIALTLHNQPGQLSANSLLGTFTDLAANPRFMVDFATAVAKAGTWQIGSWRVAGGPLLAIWLAELAILVGLARDGGRMRAAEPFCEASNTWAEELELPRKFAFIDDPDGLARFIEANAAQVFSVLPDWTEAGPPSYSQITVYRCRGGCDPYISITNCKVEISKEKLEETKKLVVNFLRLPGMDADDVIRQGMEQAQSSTDPAIVPGLPTPPELLTAIEDLEADRYDRALATAAPYVSSDQPGLRVDAKRLCALATARLCRWDESFSFWHSLYDEEQTAHNALQLATSSVMTGDVAGGVAWIAKALEMNAESHEVPGLLIHTNFITALTNSGQHNAALPYLDDVKQLYVNLGVTDPTFLYVRRVPLFNEFLDNSAPVIRAALNPEQGRAWYASMLPHLDDSGKTELSAWLEKGFIQTSGLPGAT
jgi:hypothetical protein